MSEKKRVAGLGRGLSALLDEIEVASSVSPAGSGEPQLVPSQTLPISALRPNPRQPRRHFDQAALDELAASVRTRGLLQPILVRPRPGGHYEIVAGERRWRAAQAAQLHEVPVVVKDLDDSTAFEIALIENIQRADLNPIEEAEGYKRLIGDFGHTQEELGKLVGKSRSHVANLLRLLDLPDSVRAMVVEGKLSMGHARALITAEDPAALARKVVDEQLTVRQVEALAAGRTPEEKSDAPAPAPRARRSTNKDADIGALETLLSQTLGLEVNVEHVGPYGWVQIDYSDLEQLDMLIQKLTGEERI